jgi:hypothetical protein
MYRHINLLFHLADTVTTISYININPKPHQDEGSAAVEKLQPSALFFQVYNNNVACMIHSVSFKILLTNWHFPSFSS